MALNYKIQKSFTVKKATPGLVKELLSLNTNNRSLRRTQIDRLKKDMLAGRFYLTAQGISVSCKGILIDGQHRLLAMDEALLEKGCPDISFNIVTGLKPISQMYVDQHVKRTMSDAIHLITGEKVTTKMTAILRFIQQIQEDEDGFSMTREYRSMEENLKWFKNNHDDLQLILGAAGNSVRTGVMAALFHLAEKHDRNIAYAFAKQLKDGELLAKHEPAMLLRNYMNRNRNADRFDDYKVGVTACCAFAAGELRKSLRETHSGWSGLPKEVRSLHEEDEEEAA